MNTNEESFGEWCVLELMGRRKLAGFVREVTLAGAGLLRIDVYEGDADTAALTQFYPPASLYALTPVTEEIARRFAKAHTQPPVSRYELPSPEGARRAERWENDVDEQDLGE